MIYAIVNDDTGAVNALIDGTYVDESRLVKQNNFEVPLPQEVITKVEELNAASDTYFKVLVIKGFSV